MDIIPLGDRFSCGGRRHTQWCEGTAVSEAVPDALTRGVLVAAGTGRCGHDGANIPLAIRAGDTILVGREAAQELTLGSLRYWLMNADVVLSIENSAPPLWTWKR